MIDTRFLLEHFYSSDPEVRHATSLRIAKLTKRKEGIIPTVVVGEVVRVTCERRGVEEADIRYMSLLRSGMRIVGLTPEMARRAGLLKCRHGDVPIGDCIIASTAIIERARVLSDDPHFDIIKEVRRVWI